MVDRVPLSDEYISAQQVARYTIEAAEYYLEQVTQDLTERKMLPGSQGIIDNAKKFVEMVRMSMSTEGWESLEIDQSFFKALQRNMGEMILNAIKSAIEENNISMPLHMDYAFDGNTAQFVRGYSSDGKKLVQEFVDMLDKLLNSCFAEENMISKDGVLYQSDIEGEIELTDDAKKKPILASAEKVDAVITDVLKPALATVEIPLEATRHESAQAPGPAPKEAEVRATAPTQEASKPDEVQPEEPQTSIKTGAG